MIGTQSIWCIGSAKFVKEISPLVDQHARVKWIAENAALLRNLATSPECHTAIVEHLADNTSLAFLQAVRTKFPRARRLVVVDGCDLKTLRAYLEAEVASEILYRPLDQLAMLRSCGLTPPSVLKAVKPPKAPSHA